MALSGKSSNSSEYSSNTHKSLYFTTTHGTKKKWSYIADGHKIKSFNKKVAPLDQIMWSYNQGWS